MSGDRAGEESVLVCACRCSSNEAITSMLRYVAQKENLDVPEHFEARLAKVGLLPMRAALSWLCHVRCSRTLSAMTCRRPTGT